MAKRSTKRTTKRRKAPPKPPPWRRALRWAARGVVAVVALVVLWVAAYRWIDPPTTPYIAAEAARLGAVERVWLDMDDIDPVMMRSAVAAEDADFCNHWGFDLDAIRGAIEAGGSRGASTISQQVVKNVFLWHGRSWARKGLEAGLTPLMEALWPKRRILEVYLNVAEFDEGVFGVEAGARRYFGVSAGDLTAEQAARLAAVLPAPKRWSARAPSDRVARRARAIADGAATIRRDGRADCFGGA
ncbi:monofunctional biosynthetic peptidoglycan transglycosylase [Jannaschia sp. Os4]|uniref:monofunctional biosynthetic peptidoglycan transglycosylase n=1 Tax=Jannaschia sp. Os4 TaxID=2807617 RepID=UPI0019394E94|nr:monofunctional biosynthetic peptidoglycan transglycosylase [Jannaschia sp. Os4]MBM2575634.1 monofunctional biosynthetic peptidoglycan transglycosylase [Jannaschia sp. Os4]